MNKLEQSAANETAGEGPSAVSQLTLYNKFGAVAYGVILQIIPQKEVAQEVLLEVFTSPELLTGIDRSVSPCLYIIQIARQKALAIQKKSTGSRDRLPTLPPGTGDRSPARVFQLAFTDGYSPDDIAGLLGISKAEVVKAIREYILSFRQS